MSVMLRDGNCVEHGNRANRNLTASTLAFNFHGLEVASRENTMNRDTNPSKNSFFTVVGRGEHDVRRHNLTKADRRG